MTELPGPVPELLVRKETRADQTTELACDVFEALPPRVVDFHSYRT